MAAAAAAVKRYSLADISTDLFDSFNIFVEISKVRLQQYFSYITHDEHGVYIAPEGGDFFSDLCTLVQKSNITSNEVINLTTFFQHFNTGTTSFNAEKPVIKAVFVDRRMKDAVTNFKAFVDSFSNKTHSLAELRDKTKLFFNIFSRLHNCSVEPNLQARSLEKEYNAIFYRLAEAEHLAEKLM
jgi:hypothetical protein